MARIPLCRLVLLLVAATASVIASAPACQQVAVGLRANPGTVRRGRQTTVKVKLTNLLRSSATSINVRLDLPAGLVAFPKSSTNPIVVGTGAAAGGGSTVYWIGAFLRPSERRILKLRIRPCSSAAAGPYSVGGAVYAVNSTGGVTCLSPIAKPAVVSWAWGGRVSLFHITLWLIAYLMLFVDAAAGPCPGLLGDQGPHLSNPGADARRWQQHRVCSLWRGATAG